MHLERPKCHHGYVPDFCTKNLVQFQWPGAGAKFLIFAPTAARGAELKNMAAHIAGRIESKA
jgi:hypothetical protein